MALRLSPHMTVMANAAQKAAKRLLRDFAEVEQLQVSVKGPSDFVSQADIRAEQILKEELNKARPGYAFLMEESGASGSDNWAWRWVVDPLDGTTNFLHGMPHWAISIGLERRLPDGGSRTGRRAGLRAAVGRDVLGGKGWRRLRQRAPPAGVGAARAEGRGVRHRHSVRRGAAGAAHGVLPHAGAADAAGGGRPPVRRRGAGPRLGRRRPVRRLLGAGRQALGHRRRPAAGARGRRLRHRPARARDPRDTGDVVAANPHLHPKLREAVLAGIGPAEVSQARAG